MGLIMKKNCYSFEGRLSETNLANGCHSARDDVYGQLELQKLCHRVIDISSPNTCKTNIKYNKRKQKHKLTIIKSNNCPVMEVEKRDDGIFITEVPNQMIFKPSAKRALVDDQIIKV